MITELAFLVHGDAMEELTALTDQMKLKNYVQIFANAVAKIIFVALMERVYMG